MSEGVGFNWRPKRVCSKCKTPEEFLHAPLEWKDRETFCEACLGGQGGKK